MIHLAITLVILLAVVAVLQIAIRAMGVVIPNWVIQILYVILVAAVVIVAIKFLAGL